MWRGGRMAANRRWLRRLLVVLVALLVALGTAAGLLYSGNRHAIAFLSTMASDDPVDAEFQRAVAWDPPPRETATTFSLEPESDGAPIVVLVAGLTPDGIRDPRVARLAWAFRRAGPGVVAPAGDQLRRPGEGTDGVAVVRAALRATAEGRAGPARGNRSRLGLVGVSLGAAIALRAAVDAPATLRAVLLVGAPDDTRALAKEWFRRGIAPEGTTGRAWAASDAAIFARHEILRTALPGLVPAAESPPLFAWIDAARE